MRSGQTAKQIGMILAGMAIFNLASYGPARAHIAYRALARHKAAGDPDDAREVLYGACYAPLIALSWHCPPFGRLSARYTYFSFLKMYGYPAPTLFL